MLHFELSNPFIKEEKILSLLENLSLNLARIQQSIKSITITVEDSSDELELEVLLSLFSFCKGMSTANNRGKSDFGG